MNKVILYLMTKKGYFILSKYLEIFSVNTIEAVVIGRDKNVINDYYLEIVSLCEKNNISFYNRNDVPTQFSSDYCIVISWRWLINSDKKIIVLHDSVLPKYRGFAPLINSLINKEKEIGVTALFATDKYDEGQIIGQKSVKINYPMKIADAIDIINLLYFELVFDIVSDIVAGKKIVGVNQSNEEATYSLWRDEEDYLIDWKKSADDIKCFIDAVGFPYFGAKTSSEAKYYRIFEASVLPDVNIENRIAGKIIFFDNINPVVVCGKGLLKIEKIVYDGTNESALPFKKFRIKFI